MSNVGITSIVWSVCFCIDIVPNSIFVRYAPLAIASAALKGTLVVFEHKEIKLISDEQTRTSEYAAYATTATVAGVNIVLRKLLSEQACFLLVENKYTVTIFTGGGMMQKKSVRQSFWEMGEAPRRWNRRHYEVKQNTRALHQTALNPPRSAASGQHQFFFPSRQAHNCISSEFLWHTLYCCTQRSSFAHHWLRLIGHNVTHGKKTSHVFLRLHDFDTSVFCCLHVAYGRHRLTVAAIPSSVYRNVCLQGRPNGSSAAAVDKPLSVKRKQRSLR